MQNKRQIAVCVTGNSQEWQTKSKQWNDVFTTWESQPDIFTSFDSPQWWDLFHVAVAKRGREFGPGDGFCYDLVIHIHTSIEPVELNLHIRPAPSTIYVKEIYSSIEFFTTAASPKLFMCDSPTFDIASRFFECFSIVDESVVCFMEPMKNDVLGHQFFYFCAMTGLRLERIRE